MYKVVCVYSVQIMQSETLLGDKIIKEYTTTH